MTRPTYTNPPRPRRPEYAAQPIVVRPNDDVDAMADEALEPAYEAAVAAARDAEARGDAAAADAAWERAETIEAVAAKRAAY